VTFLKLIFRPKFCYDEVYRIMEDHEYRCLLLKLVFIVKGPFSEGVGLPSELSMLY
jgi:hypothetical protein